MWRRWRSYWLVFSQAVTIALAVLFVVAAFVPGWRPRLPGAPGTSTTAPGSPVSQAPRHPGAIDAPDTNDRASSSRTTVDKSLPGTAATMPSLAPAARRAAPAVVSIVASRPGRDGLAQTGLGSGVIVSPEGYLLTNNHVVEGAGAIEIELADGRRAPARLIGIDAETDLALLKTDLDGLPALPFVERPALQVGDVVLAIGNPFNVGQTVTSGIVSALGRSQPLLSAFETFIQTDAAINPGNSGGALVDAQGELVGINTAIVSGGGGNLGIGFAIPADTARQVMQALLRDGEVRRGWIGVELRELTPELAESLSLPLHEGVLVTGVLGGGPAAAAGVRPGDAVLRVGDTRVASASTLLAVVAALQPGTRITLELQRDRHRFDAQVQVAQRPQPPQRR